jgi:hypothetical protein
LVDLQRLVLSSRQVASEGDERSGNRLPFGSHGGTRWHVVRDAETCPDWGTTLIRAAMGSDVRRGLLR